MSPSLDLAIEIFLNKHWNGSSPLLLAFSGGPDSLALLHLLLSYFQKKNLNPHNHLVLAHVDHGWRSESEGERKAIEKMAMQLHLKLHSKCLDPSTFRGNLEEVCRKERLHFFSELCLEHGYQAVLLAQHADDQAETVLKRVLEGASLGNLGGMKQVAGIEGLVVWRPLLNIPKKLLLNELASRSLVGFDDYTNRDPRFLRAKLRLKILPELALSFGKEVAGNLVNLGAEALEMQEYLEEKAKPFLEQVQQGPFGTWLDFTPYESLKPLEVKYLVRKCCEIENVFLSRVNVRTAAELLIEKRANKSLSAGINEVYVDRGHLFVLPQRQKQIVDQRLLLEPGLHSFGMWKVHVTCQQSEDELPKASSWRQLWKGRGVVSLPMGDYHLSFPEKMRAFDKQWTDAKVPAFLRSYVPAVYAGNRTIHEFLSGRQVDKMKKIEGSRLRIELWAT